MTKAGNEKTKAKAIKKGATTSKAKSMDAVSGNQRILNFTLTLEMKSGHSKVSRKEVMAKSAVKPSTFAVAISNMKKKGSILYDAETIELTENGRAKAHVMELPDNNTYQEALQTKHKLGGKHLLLFNALLDGKKYDRAAIAEEIGCTNKATFAVMISNMKKKGIISYDRETIELSDECFPNGRPE